MKRTPPTSNAAGKSRRLADIPTRPKEAASSRKPALQKELAREREKLAVLQARLWAEGRRSLLVVLQGMDTAGKDGIIRHVFSGMNPSGCVVAAFKVPSEEERSHDFLWRIHRAAPRAGTVVVFNRSHYEDVGVVRVHQLVPDDVWKQRYERINEFEKQLATSGTTILKFFLHISKDEQAERFRDRLADPEARWKFNPRDLEERKLWGKYQEAWDDAIRLCSTPHAPWIVVPADSKPFARVTVARAVRRALEAMDPHPPEPDFDPATIRIE